MKHFSLAITLCLLIPAAHAQGTKSYNISWYIYDYLALNYTCEVQYTDLIDSMHYLSITIEEVQESVRGTNYSILYDIEGETVDLIIPVDGGSITLAYSPQLVEHLGSNRGYRTQCSWRDTPSEQLVEVLEYELYHQLKPLILIITKAAERGLIEVQLACGAPRLTYFAFGATEVMTDSMISGWIEMTPDTSDISKYFAFMFDEYLARQDVLSGYSDDSRRQQYRSMERSMQRRVSEKAFLQSHRDHDIRQRDAFYQISQKAYAALDKDDTTPWFIDTNYRIKSGQSLPVYVEYYQSMLTIEHLALGRVGEHSCVIEEQ